MKRLCLLQLLGRLPTVVVKASRPQGLSSVGAPRRVQVAQNGCAVHCANQARESFTMMLKTQTVLP